MTAESVHCEPTRCLPCRTIEAAAKSKPHENPKKIEVTKQKQDSGASLPASFTCLTTTVAKWIAAMITKIVERRSPVCLVALTTL
jgi:hypothetical protein